MTALFIVLVFADHTILKFRHSLCAPKNKEQTWHFHVHSILQVEISSCYNEENYCWAFSNYLWEFQSHLYTTNLSPLTAFVSASAALFFDLHFVNLTTPRSSIFPTSVTSHRYAYSLLHHKLISWSLQRHFGYHMLFPNYLVGYRCCCIILIIGQVL